MIISVDFDDTLQIGSSANLPLIEKLRQHQRHGDTVILNTCRQGKRLSEAVRFCAQHGLSFSAVNDNLPQVIAHFGYNPRKIFADVYIDDKAIKP